ncbi:hypothetical protein A2572_03205 [Candidatus Collierbacteria bacterium RIFOXYD1_FULL_40_9]|uniref:RCK N-terminal domain-containing protein n=1 Tax=Candidatus Collierbacteria bacterium RIFOXYD1_FULL_40_9 TaxID=1817731 RepID=A0A1F5FWW1_9BACT|nr:MAG: hypothetical protein A2572_03205 [Candidatus Collierbacteria bacterium RIFOXYD1_FULL_40_9]
MELFTELSKVLILTTSLSVLAKILKQPLIIAYILSGILAGPLAFNILKSGDALDIFSKVGISILLFIVGLNLNPKVIKEVGKVSLYTGVLQVIFTSLIGYFISVFLGLNHVSALYVSIALTFSSTIIVLKLLSDKGDFQKLYGKIAIGFLLVQDVIASLILLFVSSGTSQNTSPNTITSLVIKFFILCVVLIVFNHILLPKITKYISSNQELLFLFSITWGLGLGSVFYLLGFSIEIGSLIAGVSLSSSQLAYEISSRLKPIRDFFITIFFVLLGSHMSFENLDKIIPQAIIFSLFVLIGNPFIVVIIMNLLGHKRKTSFLAGLTVAQISEFSLILATLGFNLKHISKDTLSLITIVGLITISISTYFIIYAEKIFEKVEFLLKILELKKNNHYKENQNQNYDTLLFGFDRVGTHFTNHFQKNNRCFLVVDLNPERALLLERKKLPYLIGDASDIDFLEDLNLKTVKLIISTIPDFQTNSLILKEAKRNNPQVTFITISHNNQEAQNLYQQGASFVSIPHYLGAKHITNLINKYGVKHNNFKNERQKHLNYLQKTLV